jgi:hypothetical protein
MADLVLPAKKGGQQQGASGSSSEKYNFGIYLKPKVTLVTQLKCGNGGYLAWIFQFWGQKIN